MELNSVNKHKSLKTIKLWMFESSISKGKEKRNTEVKLCEMADHVIGVGLKLNQTFRSYVSSCNNDGNVFN